jgi:hypothetical protein
MSIAESIHVLWSKAQLTKRSNDRDAKCGEEASLLEIRGADMFSTSLLSKSFGSP